MSKSPRHPFRGLMSLSLPTCGFGSVYDAAQARAVTGGMLQNFSQSCFETNSA